MRRASVPLDCTDPQTTKRKLVIPLQVARKNAEMLTRDADDPKEASGEDILPPPPSKLWAVGATVPGKANGIKSPVDTPKKPAANGHANGVAKGKANGIERM